MLNSFVSVKKKKKRKVINAILFALFFMCMYLEDIVFAVVGLLRLTGDRPRNQENEIEGSYMHSSTSTQKKYLSFSILDFMRHATAR